LLLECPPKWLSETADEVDEEEEDGGDSTSSPLLFSICFVGIRVFLGMNVSFECNFHNSTPVFGTADPPEKPGRFAVSIRKSSSVAKDSSCLASDEMVFWHSDSLLAAATSRSCKLSLLDIALMREVQWKNLKRNGKLRNNLRSPSYGLYAPVHTSKLSCFFGFYAHAHITNYLYAQVYTVQIKSYEGVPLFSIFFRFSPELDATVDIIGFSNCIFSELALQLDNMHLYIQVN